MGFLENFDIRCEMYVATKVVNNISWDGNFLPETNKGTARIDMALPYLFRGRCGVAPLAWGMQKTFGQPSSRLPPWNGAYTRIMSMPPQRMTRTEA